jgi:DNA-binding CsgD family transcriptional regulator
MLLGRRSEREVLDGLLRGARAGRSGVLVVRGEPGVGKTALLEYAIESASDLTVAHAVGVECEMELAFAALHQLCGPMLDGLDRLPDPQRDALGTALGRRSGDVSDCFLTGLAILSLLSEVSEHRPLLCVVDEAQWLDRASRQTLAFAARRLLAESVVLLFGSREPGRELRGLPELVVGGLAEHDARELVRSVIPGPLDERVADQIVADAHGTPLALLELLRELTPAQLAGGFGLPGAVELSSGTEASFLHRFEGLPEDTRRLLLAAAADPTGDPALLWRAGTRLSITGPVLEPAERDGLLELGVRARFCHPLVRSAVYRAASPEERRQVHRALADATDPEVDTDRRAWHLAEAVAGPDDEVAAELEQAAGRAQARGGLAAAAAFRARATALTVEPTRRAERALAAAQTKYEAGALGDALALVATADAVALDDLQRAQLDLLRAQITFASRPGSEAPPLLLTAARDLERVDANLARTTYLEALSAALFAGRLAPGGGVVGISKAALAAPPPSQPSRPSNLLLQGLAVRFTEGYAAGAAILKRALSAFTKEPTLPPHESRWLGLAGWVASDLWDDETWMLLAARRLELVKGAGALAAFPMALTNLSVIHALRGELGAAASLVSEMQAAMDATGVATGPYAALWLAALQGRESELLQLIETTVSEAVARGEGFVLATMESTKATLYNGLGRYDAALAAVRHADEPSYDFGSPTRRVAELIEAAVRCRQPQLARRALAQLAKAACASGTDWALGIEARSRAVLGDGDATENLYQEAIERLERTCVRVELARAHLLYGEWLRRQRRRKAARKQLRTAHEMLTEMGVEAFAERAERELAATGERVRKRSVETQDELTAQEAQIARLARDGLSNPEIAGRMFISRYTVDYHLHKVFTKLAISSRNQLARVLPPEPNAPLRPSAPSAYACNARHTARSKASAPSPATARPRRR